MNQNWRLVVSLVFGWILWQHVPDLNSQSEKWINQTSYLTQQRCLSDASRIIDQIRNDYILRGFLVPYLFDEGHGGFFLGDKEKHVFMCYSSEFDSRPRA